MIFQCREFFISGSSPVILSAYLRCKFIIYIPKCSLRFYLLSRCFSTCDGNTGIELFFYLFRERHNFTQLKFLEDILYFTFVTIEVCIDFGRCLLELIGASVFDTLLACVPFGCINTVTCGELNALAIKDHAHSDWHVFSYQYPVLFAGFKLEGDIPFEIHIWRV